MFNWIMKITIILSTMSFFLMMATPIDTIAINEDFTDLFIRNDKFSEENIKSGTVNLATDDLKISGTSAETTSQMGWIETGIQTIINAIPYLRDVLNLVIILVSIIKNALFSWTGIFGYLEVPAFLSIPFIVGGILIQIAGIFQIFLQIVGVLSGVLSRFI